MTARPLFLIGLLLASGCAEPGNVSLPEPVQVGTTYTYVTNWDTEVVFTSAGVQEIQGQEWHVFDKEGMVPTPFWFVGYLHVETGGVPNVLDSHENVWDRYSSLPWLLWEEPEGHVIRESGDGRLVGLISIHDGVRVVKYEIQGLDENGDVNLRASERTMRQDVGEVMPSFMQIKSVFRDGEWTRVANMTLVDVASP